MGLKYVGKRCFTAITIGGAGQCHGASWASVKPELAVAGIKVRMALREPVSRRAFTVLEIKTKSGLIGYGECPSAPDESLAVAKQVTLGLAATSYEVIGQKLAAYPGMQAAVGMALLDIAGKFAKAPVYQLLGGPTRNKARALAPLAGATDMELVAAMKRAREAGHRAFLVPTPAIVAANQGQAFVHATRAPGSKACARKADQRSISSSTARDG